MRDLNAYSAVFKDIGAVAFDRTLILAWLCGLSSKLASVAGLRSAEIRIKTGKELASALCNQLRAIEGDGVTVGARPKAGLAITFHQDDGLEVSGDSPTALATAKRKVVVSPSVKDAFVDAADLRKLPQYIANYGNRVAMTLAESGRNPELGYWLALARYSSSLIKEHTGNAIGSRRTFEKLAKEII